MEIGERAGPRVDGPAMDTVTSLPRRFREALRGRAGCPFDTVGVVHGPAEHLEPAADAQDRPALAALLALDPFVDQTACAIVKHTTPCGLATAPTALQSTRADTAGVLSGLTDSVLFDMTG